MEETIRQPLITCTLTYELDADKRTGISVSLFDNMLTLNAPGFSHEIRLSDISGIRAQNYRVFISTPEGEIVFSMIGHWYEDFSGKLVRAYNEVLFQELLMKETVHFEADGYFTEPSGETARAVLRVCETAVVALPVTHGLVRIPFCLIASTDNQPYRFTITDRLGRTYMLSKMGYATDAFLLAYRTRLEELIRQTREKLSEISPADDKLAKLLMEGIVQPVADIRTASPGFASALEQKLSGSAIAEQFAYLNGISDSLAVGVKRGLMGDLTGENIILLAPVFAKNALIMESMGDSAAATYVFRLSQDGTFDPLRWQQFLLDFNDSMLSVNFRREPIYLSDKALSETQHEKYRHALRRVPALGRLRALFVGRAVHSGYDAWKKKIESLMQ